MWVYQERGHNSTLDKTAQWGPSGHYLPSIIRTIKSNSMRLEGHVANRDGKNAYRVMVGKDEGERPLGILRGSWGR